MKNKIEYILFRTFSGFFQFIGLNAARKFAPILAGIFFYFIPIRKKTVIENLKIAFPQLNEKQVKQLAFKNFKSIAITFIEIFSLPSLKKEQIEKAVYCSNLDFIKEKFNLGKGLILLSAHFGNWEFMATSIGVQLNIPLSVIVKPLRNPYVNEWMNNARTKWNNEVVPLGISIRNTYKTLLEKKIVAMVADQRGPAEGIKLNFFGKKVSAFTGPAALALKTGAPLLYGISVRQDDNSYVTKFEEISTDNLPEDEEEKIIELSRRHMKYLEKFIRNYPEQWLWMHKRWKH